MYDANRPCSDGLLRHVAQMQTSLQATRSRFTKGLWTRATTVCNVVISLAGYMHAFLVQTRTNIGRVQLPSSVPLSGELVFAGAALPAAAPEDFELSKLWKNVCKISCCVGPASVGVDGIVGEDACDRAFVLGPCAARPVADGLVLARLASFRAASAPADAPPTPLSISVSARSTLGRLKLLLPIGPTTPAAAFSTGVLKAPRGSRSVFLAFSS